MNFSYGLLLATLIASVVLSISLAVANDIGREECEKSLPRTEKCVKVWVPEKPDPKLLQPKQPSTP